MQHHLPEDLANLGMLFLPPPARRSVMPRFDGKFGITLLALPIATPFYESDGLMAIREGTPRVEPARFTQRATFANTVVIGTAHDDLLMVCHGVLLP